MNAKSTKKVRDADAEILQAEYRREDLGKGVRGKYFKQHSLDTNLVLLQPEVAKAFPNAEAVNEALRVLMQAASRAAHP